MVNIDEIYNVEIEGIGDKGDGIAKIEGLAIIVKGSTKVGEKLTIKITAVREKFAFAEIVEYDETSETNDEEDNVDEVEKETEETYKDSESFGDDDGSENVE